MGIAYKFKIYLYLGVNLIYIIGDVHGCYDTLCALIESLPNSWDSDIVFTGDVIDRGPKSCQIIDLIINRKYKCVLGNHEELMLRYYKKLEDSDVDWLIHGGYETLCSYETNGGFSKISEHLEWLLTLPYYLEFPICDSNSRRLFVTHGFGLRYYQTRDENRKEIIWNRLRKNDNACDVDSEVFNVFGHDVQREVLITDNFAAIDTGCVYHKKLDTASLSALEFPSKRVFSVRYCG